MATIELERLAGSSAYVSRRLPVRDHRRAFAALGDGGPLDLLAASPREGRTLEDLLSGAWEELSAHRTATCPVCEGAMEPRYGSGPSAVGGRCRDCCCELS